MRRVTGGVMATGLLVAVAVAGIVAMGPGASACEVDASGICIIKTVPGGGSSNPVVPIGDEGETGCRDEDGTAVACVDGYGGVWSGGPRWCYQYQLDPQPPAESPLWGGHAPSEGSLWSCDYSGVTPGNTWFVASAEPAVDPAVLAQQALDRAAFPRPGARTAPGGSAATLVGYPTWLWVDDQAWRPLSVSVTAAGATVSLAAEPVLVLWSVGSQSLTCPGPGRAWDDSLGEHAQSPCTVTVDHLLDPSGDQLSVEARVRYAVTWSCQGRCSTVAGDLGEVDALPGPSSTLTVEQRQTVVTP
ncbi:hypothetical protein [Nocardioides bruguierae]|uniref:Uncharacterized protein n=1 Tax=Nocardioides bruguierae TaxID=2945102 RepID=A0A9X2D9V4_9ACTN|nr:hypothetical protein [Nocardioides bruguierae]MCM0621957.1 hypothetical protein [Nocardioides bruguierae]